MSHPFFSSLRQHCGQRGFTLVEVMVAVSVLAIVLFSVYGVFASVNAAKLRLDSDSDEYHLARVLFDRVGRELQGTYYRNGDQTSLFQGGVDQQGRTFLALTTTAVTPMSETGAGIARVRYRLDPDKQSEGDMHVLLRSERPRGANDVGDQDLMMRMAPGIESLSLKFFSGNSWEEEWDAAQNGLPQLVEVALIVMSEQRRIPFRTTFDIPDVIQR